MDAKKLEQQYLALTERAKRFLIGIVEQIEHLLLLNEVSLGVPLESRVKTWTSINEKIERKSLSLETIQDLEDLIGIRLILLFRNDAEKVCKLLETNFKVLSREETGERLGETQFGYQSTHYVIGIPKNWLEVPTMAGLGDFRCEVQVRSLAQHIWAAASHKLQYKHEASVPPPLRRTINRISALLEIVDLEFDRVLGERAIYVSDAIATSSINEPLNVETLKAALKEFLPAANESGTEDFEDLLVELTQNKIATKKDLKRLLQTHEKDILRDDWNQVKELKTKNDNSDLVKERIASGVFFSFAGLARSALKHHVAAIKKEG